MVVEEISQARRGIYTKIHPTGFGIIVNGIGWSKNTHTHTYTNRSNFLFFNGGERESREILCRVQLRYILYFILWSEAIKRNKNYTER